MVGLVLTSVLTNPRPLVYRAISVVSLEMVMQTAVGEQWKLRRAYPFQEGHYIRDDLSRIICGCVP